MKKTVLIIICIVFTISSCKKDVSTPTQKSSFPFETANVKITVVSDALMSKNIKDTHFIDEANGIVITYEGEILKTTDKGVSWNVKYSNPTPNQPLLKIVFTDQNTGYVAGGADWCNGNGCVCPGGIVLKTIDGGNNWTVVYQKSGQLEFDGITKNTNGDLFIIQNGGESTYILKSSDGGISWNTVATFNYKLLNITFNGNTGYCTGGDGTAKIVRSTDNGNTWTTTSTLPGLWVDAICFNANIGYCIVDNFNVYKTTDNGNNWTIAYNSAECSSYSLVPLSSNSCFIFGSGGYSGGCFGYNYGACRQTIDGGKSWIENQFKDILEIRNASFYSATEGYAFAGKLLKIIVK